MDLAPLGITTARLPAAVPARRAPVSSGQLLNACRLAWERGGALAALWASDERDRGRGYAVNVALRDADGLLVLEYTLPDADAGCPDLAPIFPAANRMQRAAFDLLGVQSDSEDQRPWLWQASWPIDQFPLRRDFQALPKWQPGEEDYPFVRVAGDGVHEIPVGPVHAGIIEPGHFRFQVVGEKVLRLEERLGYVHKGIEKRFESLAASPRATGSPDGSRATAPSPTRGPGRRPPRRSRTWRSRRARRGCARCCSSASASPITSAISATSATTAASRSGSRSSRG